MWCFSNPYTFGIEVMYTLKTSREFQIQVLDPRRGDQQCGENIMEEHIKESLKKYTLKKEITISMDMLCYQDKILCSVCKKVPKARQDLNRVFKESSKQIHYLTVT